MLQIQVFYILYVYACLVVSKKFFVDQYKTRNQSDIIKRVQVIHIFNVNTCLGELIFTSIGFALHDNNIMKAAIVWVARQ